MQILKASAFSSLRATCRKAIQSIWRFNSMDSMDPQQSLPRGGPAIVCAAVQTSLVQNCTMYQYLGSSPDFSDGYNSRTCMTYAGMILNPSSRTSIRTAVDPKFVLGSMTRATRRSENWSLESSASLLWEGGLHGDKLLSTPGFKCSLWDFAIGCTRDHCQAILIF